MNAITKQFADLSEQPFDVSDFVEREVVNALAFYGVKTELVKELEVLFGYYKDSQSVGYYQIDESIVDPYNKTIAQFDLELTKTVIRLLAFDDYDDSVSVFKPATVREAQFKVFYDYARSLVMEHQHKDINVWAKNLQATTFLGRFDTSVDEVTGKLKGVYEYNCDTPTMLFESMILQNESTLRITGDIQAQQNEFWTMIDDGRYEHLEYQNIAVVVESNFLEDLLSCEAVVQMFDKVGANTYLTDIKQLNHDVIFLDQPFFVDGVQPPMDYIYILLPWEEMMTSMDILTHFDRFKDRVRFFEPAWRWFMSNKVLMAYITHCLEYEDKAHNYTFFAREDSGFLKTYLSSDIFESQGLKYVKKPGIGRFSQSVAIMDEDTSLTYNHEQSGQPGYGNELMVYQEYCEPGKGQNDEKFIVCPWTLMGEPACLAIREFDQTILNWNNERFVPHILKEENDDASH